MCRAGTAPRTSVCLVLLDSTERGLGRCCPRWRWLRWRGRLCWGLGFGFGGTPAPGCPGVTDAQDGTCTPYAQYGSRASYAEDRADATDAQYRSRASYAEDAAEAQDAAVAKGAKNALRALEAETSRNVIIGAA